jgi:hypothetical protein
MIDKYNSRTMEEVVSRFRELAGQEKWFEIQDELFSDNVRSIEPLNAPHLKTAEGKVNVRRKAEEFVNRILEVHNVHTSDLICGSGHFAVGRVMDLTVEGIGRLKMEEIMLYTVQDGMIVSEQFFY